LVVVIDRFGLLSFDIFQGLGQPSVPNGKDLRRE
jgi:hypothetical protein